MYPAEYAVDTYVVHNVRTLKYTSRALSVFCLVYTYIAWPSRIYLPKPIATLIVSSGLDSDRNKHDMPYSSTIKSTAGYTHEINTFFAPCLHDFGAMAVTVGVDPVVGLVVVLTLI